eukprot:TRINITY_DN14967_c1_g1_i1.p1 TRINITY_DN14967_c1_g1~~TRINITY_DN14967_c1_g1_i1.p1  ORF type:complete len:275 (+),score=40.70 TRINITY_DN14967_c1_g1_i1:72-896(+)
MLQRNLFRSLRRATTEASGNGFRYHSLNVNGVDFHVVESGPEDGPPLLCMPGAMGTAETDFMYQLKGLPEEGFRVISFDPRGYGKSRPPSRVFPIDFYHIDGADAAGIMEGLGIDEYKLMGWSDGANAAIILASKIPEKIEKLVVFGGNSFVTSEDIEAYEATRNVEKSWSAGMKAKHVPLYGSDLQPMWSSFCDGMKSIYDNGGDICKAEARLLQCPTLIVHGSKDPIVPNNHPAWFEANIPDSSSYYFPEGKHNIHIKYSQDFNSLVSNFLL